MESFHQTVFHLEYQCGAFISLCYG